MSYSYLDKTGLASVWAKIKEVLATKANSADLADIATSGSYNDLTNKPTIPSKTSDLTNDSGFLTTHQDITGKENISNKVTSISSSSTNTQYPSAKAVYDAIDAIPSGGGSGESIDHDFIREMIIGLLDQGEWSNLESFSQLAEHTTKVVGLDEDNYSYYFFGGGSREVFYALNGDYLAGSGDEWTYYTVVEGGLDGRELTQSDIPNMYIYTVKGGGVPNWNASENEIGYIQNRPFYREESNETEIIAQEQTVTVENGAAEITAVSDFTGFALDDKLILTINNGAFIINLTDIRDINGDYWALSGEEADVAVVYSQQGQLILRVPTNETMSVQIKIEKVTYIYHKIDSNYLPSDSGSGSPEIFVGSTTPSGYTLYIDPNGMVENGEGVSF